MRKRFAVILSTVASIILVLCILFSALQLTMNDKNYIEYEYSRLQVARGMGMSNMDLVNSCNRLIDYMEGRVDSIDILVTVNGEQVLMFDQPQEVSHMADVRLLYQNFRTYRDFGLLLALVLYLFSAILHVRTAMHTLASGYLYGAFVIALFAGFIGTWAALDFSSFWTFFHQMLFWNEDWLFDATTSRMINMLPEKFFSDMILRMAAIAGAAFLLLLGGSIALLVSMRKKRMAARERARQRALAARAAKREAAAKQHAAAQGAAGQNAAGQSPAVTAGSTPPQSTGNLPQSAGDLPATEEQP